jgi:peptidoglycan hydrolase-like protein with peptidoglycan-binding domain
LPFAALQALPTDGRAISIWPDRDSAYLNIIDGVEAAAREVFSADRSLVSDWSTALLMRRQVVKFVQRFLTDEGLYTGSIDGEPVDPTFQAVMKFQRTQRIRVDGRIGPETLAAIQRVMKGRSSKTDDQTALSNRNGAVGAKEAVSASAHRAR